MKRLAPALFAVSLAAAAADAPGPVQVTYRDPDRFVDVGFSPSDAPRVRAGLLEEFRRYAERDAAALLPAGTRLEVTITQLDMAGSFRPGPGGGPQMRVINESTPPRIDLRFVLRGADGAVLGEGRRKLRNPQFILAAQPSSAPLRHERDLFEDWVRRELAAARWPARARRGPEYDGAIAFQERPA
jgi:hypothetical protein